MNAYFPFKTLVASLSLISLVACSDASVERNTAGKGSIAALSQSDCEQLLSKGVLSEGNPIACDRLVKVFFSFDSGPGSVDQAGELIVLDSIAPTVLNLMDDLLAVNFYIEKTRPMELYMGNDNLSMADNNTSAFSSRPIAGSENWSTHAYGVAIDVNPLQNPVIEIEDSGEISVNPVAAAKLYLNRHNSRPEKPRREGLAEDVRNIFFANGFFVWGGYWDEPIDYQHYQVGPRVFVERLANLSAEDGGKLLADYTSEYRMCVGYKLRQTPTPELQRNCVEKILERMSKN